MINRVPHANNPTRAAQAVVGEGFDMTPQHNQQPVRVSYRDFLPVHFRAPLGNLRTSDNAAPGHVIMTGSGTAPVIVVANDKVVG